MLRAGRHRLRSRAERVLVIADGKASAKVVAADLLAQSEHDVNAKGILLTTDEHLERA